MKKKNYAGIDAFRLAAAFMVIRIHTAPFSKISPELDFLLTYCIGRVAVPFFSDDYGIFYTGALRVRRMLRYTENAPVSAEKYGNICGTVERNLRGKLFSYACC